MLLPMTMKKNGSSDGQSDERGDESSHGPMNRAMDGGDGQCDGMDGLIKRGLRTKDEGRARTVL